jgi:hypothetical protein
MDIITVNLIISSLTLIVNLIGNLHFKHCQSGCCESDCIKTPPSTPLNERDNESTKLLFNS